MRMQRLKFRSWHRGMREMDLILGTFADKYLPQFTEAELDSYESILGINDPDLFSLMSGKASVPAEYNNNVMLMLLQHSCKG